MAENTNHKAVAAVLQPDRPPESEARSHLSEIMQQGAADHASFLARRRQIREAYHGGVLRDSLHRKAQALKAQIQAETAGVIKEAQEALQGEEQDSDDRGAGEGQ